MKSVSFRNIDITGGYWKAKQELNAGTAIFAVHDRFEDTGRFEAMKFNWKEGMDGKPHYFWDSDVAKWMEGAAYIVGKNGDKELKRILDECVALIAEHQDECGYYNIWHTVVEPDNRFKNREHHELYCLGHFIEAAVAMKTSMGDDRLIEIFDRYIDYVIDRFCVKKDAGFVTPGHEEIELALFRLYAVKPEKKYLDLAMFFLNERGKRDEYHWEGSRSCYNQSHMPVREQREAVGHSVRAGYLYTAMADAARVTGDAEMLAACKALFDDITEKKMYISGGIGSTNRGEAFTIPYDLQNDKAYTESCAGIALAYFANRMKDLDHDSKYSDVIERLLYNGITSAISLDGRSFFYENPMEINLADRGRFTSTYDRCELPLPTRSEVFGCSCCPPNITRFLASVGDYILSEDDDALYVHQYMPMTAETDAASLTVETDYPANGRVRFAAKAKAAKYLAVRVPGWCRDASFSPQPVKTERGYVWFELGEGETVITADFAMKPFFAAANPKVRADAGKTALVYGPVVYCAEKIDNDFDLWSVMLDTDSEPEMSFDEYFGENVFTVSGSLVRGGAALYTDLSALKTEDVRVKFIPYCGFANRGESDMRVWFGY